MQFDIVAIRAVLREKVNACCDRHGLMNMHHCLNKLLECLEKDGEHEVRDAILQALARDDGMNGSSWIAPGMQRLFEVTL